MRHAFGTFVLIVVTSFFLFTAWISGTTPEKFAERLGLALANAGGFNEIRAQYAGFFLAAAVFCAASLAGSVSRQAAFSVLAVIFGGLIAGRLVSLGLNRGVAGYGPTILALYAIDAIGLAMTVTAMVLDKRHL
jgi:hypothetical protein